MSDITLLIVLLVILIVISINIKNPKNEEFQNTEQQKRYFKYVLTDEKNIKYELYTFSQLNFNLQKKILDKIQTNDDYKNIIDTTYLNSAISTGSRYMPINDLVFAVRANRVFDSNVLSYKPKLLFGENNEISYSVLDFQIITQLPKSVLTAHNDILLLSIPDDDFNKKNNITLETVNISQKNVKLVQIDDSYVSLVKLTDLPTNFKIEKEEVYI